MAKWVTVCAVVITAFALDVTRAANWLSGPQDGGSSQYACAGGSLSLPWKFRLAPGDVIHDIQWFYTNGSKQLMAFYSHGAFLPLPAFSDRGLQFVANGGVQMDQLTVSDAGNYSVELSYNDASGALFMLRRSVSVQIGATDATLTGDGNLHITQSPAAVLDTTGNHWTIQLRCGHFSSHNQPSFDLEWVSPSGTVQGSSGYRDGQFHFLLPSPVTGGNYTCRVTAPSTQGCLPDREATITVDSTGVRLSILEAQRTSDQARLATLEAKQTASEALQARQAAELGALKAENNHLKEQLNNVTGLSRRRRVSFYAQKLRNSNLGPLDVMVVNDVVVNQGEAYSKTTGYFTAPYNGTYFFAATTGPDYTANGSWAPVAMNMEVENGLSRRVAQTNAHDDAGQEVATINAVLHVTVGKRVWLQAIPVSTVQYWSWGTLFSGFLISADP